MAFLPLFEADFVPLLLAEFSQDCLLQDHAELDRGETIAAACRQQRLVPSLHPDYAHAPPLGRLADVDRALILGWWLRQLDQFDFDLAVHAQRELVVGTGKPRRTAFGPHHLLHVLEILADNDTLVWH